VSNRHPDTVPDRIVCRTPPLTKEEPVTQIQNIEVAQRCVNEWLAHLSRLDREDERFVSSLEAYREAVALRNRLEDAYALRK